MDLYSKITKLSNNTTPHDFFEERQIPDFSALFNACRLFEDNPLELNAEQRSACAQLLLVKLQSLFTFEMALDDDEWEDIINCEDEDSIDFGAAKIEIIGWISSGLFEIDAIAYLKNIVKDEKQCEEYRCAALSQLTTRFLSNNKVSVSQEFQLFLTDIGNIEWYDKLATVAIKGLVKHFAEDETTLEQLKSAIVRNPNNELLNLLTTNWGNDPAIRQWVYLQYVETDDRELKNACVSSLDVSLTNTLGM